MLQKYGKGGSDAKWMQKKILYWQIFEEVALNYDCAAQKKKDSRVSGKDFQKQTCDSSYLNKKLLLILE